MTGTQESLCYRGGDCSRLTVPDQTRPCYFLQVKEAATVALSICEIEYISLATTTQESMFLTQL